jgi:hypothetical protein
MGTRYSDGELEIIESAIQTVARAKDGHKGRFKLSPEETKRLLLIEKDLRDLRRSPPFNLKIESGDKPLYKPRTYDIRIVCYSEVSHPAERTIKVTIGDDANISADLVS